jgi:MYXO-CTERM domain-containing protein
MSFALIAALAVSGPVLPQCSWDRPGANPFTGDVIAAVDRYQDIPVAAREALKARMAARRYDEIATITRDDIVGAYRYEGLRDMHFGGGTVCRSVTRERWQPKVQERGLVYCEQEHCIIVPTVCRNVSRITRVPAQKAAAADSVGPPEALPGERLQVAGIPKAPTEELQFESPAAGNQRSFALAATEPASALLPSGSDSGLGGGSGGGSDGGTVPFAGFGGGLPGTGPALFSAPPGPLGLPGVPGVPGVGPVTVTAVPEPSAVLMALAALGVLWGAARRRRPPQAGGAPASSSPAAGG